MPDINLLGDTNRQTDPSAEAKRKKAVPPAPVEMSRPLSFGDQDRPLKKPSSLGLWMRSLVSGRSKDKRRSTPAVPTPAPRVPATSRQGQATGADPVDIFSDLGKDFGGPVAAKATAPSPAPTGPRPGDFPPLPTMPAWQGSVSRPEVATTPMPSATNPTASAESFPARRSFSVPPATPSSPATPATTSTGRGIPPASGLRIPPVPPNKQARSIDDLGDSAMNLLPDDLVTNYDPKKKLTTVILVAIATALVIGIADVSLLLWKTTVTRQASEKSGQASVIDAQIKGRDIQADYQAAVRLREANVTLSKLLDTHIYWSQFLQKFEKYTLSTVAYPNGVQASPGASLTLTGTAPDLATLIAQLDVYRDATDFITSANVSAVTRDPKKGNYTFVVDLEFKPEVLLNPISSTPSSTPQTSNTNASS